MRRAWAACCALAAALALGGCAGGAAEQEALPEQAAPAQESETGAKPDALQAPGDVAGYAAAEFADIPAQAVLSIAQLQDKIGGDEPFQLIDIRPTREFVTGHIAGSRNIPAGTQVQVRLAEFAADRDVVLVSSGEDRLAEVRAYLVDAGLDEGRVLVVDGGVEAWAEAGGELEVRRAMMC